MRRVLFRILIPLLLIPLIWVLTIKFESTEPQIEIELPSVYLKKGYEFSLHVTDKKNGLQKIVVSIMQKGKEKVLLDKQYSSSFLSAILNDANNTDESFIIPVNFQSFGLEDGEALIRVMSSDFSWRGWGRGNIAYTEERVFIDSTPPKIQVLTRQHNIERGGSGLVIYKVFEERLRSGVRVGDNFFPGYPGLFKNNQVYAAFFAIDHMQGKGTPVFLEAEDLAGNKTTREFYHYIRDKQFRTDKLNISNNFLNQKIPGFDIGDEEKQFSQASDPLLEKFLFINRTVRKNNVDLLLGTPINTDNKKHWDGAFLRMRGAAKRAGFADRRTYWHKGRKVDKAVHLGIDLASTSNAPIQAANTGRVILSQFVGIFGNTVIIDHGFGVCSLYSHLSQSAVVEGQMVAKGEEIGRSGLTGLAGGDHLHFSMIVHNIFVNPVEWWDDTWIINNITSKIDAVRQMPEAGS